LPVLSYHPLSGQIETAHSVSVPQIFDRRLYAARRLKAGRAGSESFLVRQAAESVAERLSAANRQFDRALDLGSRRGSFALLQPLAKEWLRTAAAPGDTDVPLVMDEEALCLAQRSFDLVASVLALHAVNDLPGTLIQIRRVLAPGGLFLAALFGGETLHELRHALAAGEEEIVGGISPRVAPFADVREAGALLQRAGFSDPVADVERLTVRYRSFGTLREDLRAMGETNSLAGRRRSLLSRRVLATAMTQYQSQYGGEEGKLPATFDIIYLTGWAPSANR
jgi:SAM-dependent methyltransferase